MSHKNKKDKKHGTINEGVKVFAGFAPGTPDAVVREYFDKEFPQSIERPCGILSWCPYGPLVEQFPVAGTGPGQYVACIEPLECGVFGHDCPVYYVAEPFADPDAIAETLCEECRAKLAESDADCEAGVLHHRC